MEYRYLIQNSSQLSAYQDIAKIIIPKMDAFIQYLQSDFGLSDLPRAVIFSDAESATKLISEIPVPAYTNEYRTIFCPELAVWREIYLRQLDRYDDPEIRRYYKETLSENHVFQILGHELVHHCDMFSDGFDAYFDSEVWFEEGMCEYISRKYFLSDAEFQEETKNNAKLVELYESAHGIFHLADFGSETYSADYASIFCGYWKSFLAVKSLIDSKVGDILAVFEAYHQCPQNHSLSEFFHLD